MYEVKGFCYVNDQKLEITHGIKVNNYTEAYDLFAAAGIQNFLFKLVEVKE